MSSKSRSKASLYQNVQSQKNFIEKQELRPLCQIKDLNGAIRLLESKYKMKEDSMRSSNAQLTTKKAPIRKMETKQSNKQIDDHVLKMISFTSLNRNIEEKSGLIERQKQEILVLKQCVNDIKTSQLAKQAEQQRIRKEEIAKLKQQQKEYSQNLRDLQLMKGHFKEIKKKYETTVNQKQILNEKYLKLFAQNQQLTLVISNLKQDLEISTGSQRILDLEQQIAHLRQDLRNHETQKESIEIRSINYEKRMNEYILKYNEVQTVLSQAQIKYYKLQKDCDNLKLDKEEVEQKLSNLNKQTQAERQIHGQEMLILKGRLKKYDEEVMQKEKKIHQLLQNDIKQDLGMRIQQLTKELKRMQNENEGLREQNAFQVKKWQRYAQQLMRHCGQQLEDKLRNCKIQNEEILGKKQRQMSNIHLFLDQRSMELKYKDETIKNYQVQVIKLQEEISEQREQEQKIVEKITLLQKQITEGNEYLHNQNHLLRLQGQQYLSNFKQALKIIEQQKFRIQTLVKQNQGILKEREAFTNKKQTRQSSQLAFSQELQHLKKENEAFQLQKRSIREEQSKQKRYYQEKYERQIQQYNQLSLQFNQLQTQNRKLLKLNAENTIQISNLKSDLHQMKKEVDKLIKQEQESQVLKYKLSDIQRANFDTGQKLALQEKKAKQLDEYLFETRSQLSTIKQVNFKIKEQFEQACAQREDLKYRLNFNYNFYQSEQARHYSQLISLSDKVRIMQEDISAKNKTLLEKDIIIGRVRGELEQHVQEIRHLTENIQMAEKKYVNLVENYHHQTIQWQQQKSKWKRELQCHRNEKKVLQHSRLSADYSLDSSQAVVEILRQQNKQLQVILGGQIEKRNATIRELINQKKTLFSQLIQK